MPQRYRSPTFPPFASLTIRFEHKSCAPLLHLCQDSPMHRAYVIPIRVQISGLELADYFRRAARYFSLSASRAVIT